MRILQQQNWIKFWKCLKKPETYEDKRVMRRGKIFYLIVSII